MHEHDISEIMDKDILRKTEYIRETLSEPTRLELLAEEAAELAKAALKLARKMRDENPTPKTMEECIENYNEEVMDVMNGIILYSGKTPVISEDKIERCYYRLLMDNKGSLADDV
jgi:NTP pyrophosphatase (non-canonical NTP hydrolase)